MHSSIALILVSSDTKKEKGKPKDIFSVPHHVSISAPFDVDESDTGLSGAKHVD